MSEKIPSLEELQKLAKEKGVELSEDMLDQVAGGYSKEVWESMTPEERKAAIQQSMYAKLVSHEHCAMDDDFG